MTPAQTKELRDLCAELPRVEDRLRRAGLYATATAMNKAVKRIGYEVAERFAAAPKTGK